MTRTVTLVLVDPAGAVLGALPPFEASVPWWQEVGEFAEERRQVLRLLAADRPAPPGGHVTYLAETSTAPAGLSPVEVSLAPHPRRAAYAEVGGPAASISWAREVLGGAVTARQQRTWNLSAIWRMDDPAGQPVAWLKQVPSFFWHEPAALRLVDEVAPGLVPPLIAAGERGRMLLRHVPGEDRYGAGAEVRARIADVFHPVQAYFAKYRATVGGSGAASGVGGLGGGAAAAEVGGLGGGAAAAGAGGLGGGAVAAPGIPAAAWDYGRVAAPYYGRVDGLAELIGGLEERFAAVRECGVPETLVHGDLHPGNVRTDRDGRITIMDWGDCAIDHPAFDILRLTEGLDDPEPLLQAWADRWTRTVPGSRPLRAVELLRPVAALRAAAVYARFLNEIEPTEWPYHAGDVPACLSASIVKG